MFIRFCCSIALAVGLCLSAGGAHAAAASGRATIIDGDTISVMMDGTPFVVRIFGIDAPETGQKCQLPKGTWNCSRTAIRALAAMAEGKVVSCDPRGRDAYGRLIGVCSTKTEPDIGAKLVASGLAWAFVKYSTDYSQLEEAPRARKLGIWQSKTQPPWEYRARRWETAAQIAPTKDCPIKGNISAKGEKIYHAPWSKHYGRTRIEPAKGERWFCNEAEAVAAGWRAPYR
jgi:endonuclease YncB( thermonuclease family)